MKKHIGIRIKEIRLRKGFKQAELAEKVSIEPNHLSKLECGYSFPSLDLLEKLAKVLEVEPSEFLSTEHLKSEEELIKEINQMLENSSKEDLKTFYRILKDINQ